MGTMPQTGHWRDFLSFVRDSDCEYERILLTRGDQSDENMRSRSRGGVGVEAEVVAEATADSAPAAGGGDSKSSCDDVETVGEKGAEGERESPVWYSLVVSLCGGEAAACAFGLVLAGEGEAEGEGLQAPERNER